MKIAVVVGMFPKISETFIVNQITGLLDRGHEVTIIAKERAEDILQSDVIDYDLTSRTLYPGSLPASRFRRLTKFAVDLIARPRRSLALLKLAAPFDSAGLQRFYLARLFQRQRFDLIHCHFGFIGRQIAEFQNLGLVGAPVVTSFHGVDIGATATAEEYQTLHRQGTSFTANSKFSSDRAVALGCPAERISLLPVGVSLPSFPFSERRLSPDRPLRLLTVGRLITSKGIHIAIGAVRQLAEAGVDVHYDVVGDGPQRAELERIAPAGSVTFHGALLREQVIERFRAADLFVLPSLGMEAQNVGMEGQGLVLQEAQAMGIPVIASRCCGIPEGVLDGESGMLVPEGDTPALTEAILKMRDAHQSWPEFGRKGRALVEQKFDIDSLNDRLVEIYEESIALCS